LPYTTIRDIYDANVQQHLLARARFCSADHGDLVERNTTTKRYGSRSFCIAALALWNKLLSHRPTDDIVVNNSHEGWRLQLFVRADLFESTNGLIDWWFILENMA